MLMKFLPAALLLAIFLLGASACVRRDAIQSAGTSKQTTNKDFPREVSDTSGEVLKIASPPQRIVSQTLGTDEILLAICSPERIVALSPFAQDPRYSNVSEQAVQLARPLVKDAEQIINLKPDLIFVSSYSRAETVDLLRATHAPVFRFANFDRLDDIKTNILIVGRSTGDDERATEVVEEMERQIALIKKRIPEGVRRPRVLSFGPSGNTVGAETLFDDVLRSAGAINVGAERGLRGFPRISSEQVAAWQPDFIVTGSESGKLNETRAKLLSDPVVAATEAGRAGRIIVIDNRYFLTVSQYIVLLLDDLVKELYGRTSEG